MLTSVVCAYCSGVNVVDIAVELQFGKNARLSEIYVKRTMRLDEFYERYREFVLNLAEFPIEKEKLLERIKRFFRCSTSLAYDILDRLKDDLGLYEQKGVIYDVDGIVEA